MKHRLFFSAALILGLAAPAMAQGYLPYRIVETDERVGSLAEAVARIGDHQGTIEVAPGTWRDCVVQTEGYITFRAAQPGQTIFDGGVCEDKATLVLRGRGARVEGLIFQNISVADGNGAGIRLEQSDLTVVNSWFRDSEEGILTADDPSGTITIDRSTFSGLGRCDRGLSCAHSIYIGHYGALNVTRSRFERGNGGHYVKSRAPRISVTASSFDDTQGNTTNYMIDLPAGATGEIAGNLFVQGEDKENWSAFIAIAAEDKEHSSSGLSVHDNDARLANGVSRNTWFVADWSGDRLALGQNRLGKGLTPFQKR
ncbi:MAG: right-handed parallel beta-helix repeat-containing protein [Blastomonas sp.]